MHAKFQDHRTSGYRVYVLFFHMKFGFDWPSGCVDDGRTPEHGYPISSPGEPAASVS